MASNANEVAPRVAVLHGELVHHLGRWEDPIAQGVAEIKLVILHWRTLQVQIVTEAVQLRVTRNLVGHIRRLLQSINNSILIMMLLAVLSWVT
jgi:hypothetical protein